MVFNLGFCWLMRYRSIGKACSGQIESVTVSHNKMLADLDILLLGVGEAV